MFKRKFSGKQKIWGAPKKLGRHCPRMLSPTVATGLRKMQPVTKQQLFLSCALRTGLFSVLSVMIFKILLRTKARVAANPITNTQQNVLLLKHVIETVEVKDLNPLVFAQLAQPSYERMRVMNSVFLFASSPCLKGTSASAGLC